MYHAQRVLESARASNSDLREPDTAILEQRFQATFVPTPNPLNSTFTCWTVVTVLGPNMWLCAFDVVQRLHKQTSATSTGFHMLRSGGEAHAESPRGNCASVVASRDQRSRQSVLNDDCLLQLFSPITMPIYFWQEIGELQLALPY